MPWLPSAATAQGKFQVLLTSELEAVQSKLLDAFDRAISDEDLAASQVRFAAELPRAGGDERQAPGFRAADPPADEFAFEVHYTSEFSSDPKQAGGSQVLHEPPQRQSSMSEIFWESGESASKESEGMVRSSRSAAQPELVLRDDWMVDTARAKRFVEHAESLSPTDLTNLLNTETGRVMNEVRTMETFTARRHSIESSRLGSMLGDQWESSDRGSSRIFSSWRCLDSSWGCELPLNPHSSGRLLWDVAGLLLVIYDAVMIPLMLMVFTQANDIGSFMPLLTNTFWTMDIGLTFMTATVIDGELKEVWVDIARHYIKTWFLLDFLMVLPEWIWMVVDEGRGGFALLRILKSFRALRLLRMVKFETIVREQLKKVNSESLLNTANLLQLVFAFLMLNHFTACCWYLIGKTTGDGWIQNEVVSISDNVVARYLMALHWSITQFHGTMEIAPGNTSERIFAVGVLITGMLTFSVMVSVSTDMIFRVRQARIKLHDQKMRLRSYFTRHAVSMELMLSVKAHLQLASATDKECQDDRELLEALPPQLGRALLLEVHQPTVGLHWLFTWMRSKHCTAFYDVCFSAFDSMAGLHGHNVFSCMDTCSCMYFIESGALRYLPMKQASEPKAPRTSVGPTSRFVQRLSRSHAGIELAKKRWVCEPALWVQAWRTHGELIPLVNSVLLRLESSCLGKIVSAFPMCHFDVAVYAHWVVQEIALADADSLVDLWTPPQKC